MTLLIIKIINSFFGHNFLRVIIMIFMADLLVMIVFISLPVHPLCCAFSSSVCLPWFETMADVVEQEVVSVLVEGV